MNETGSSSPPDAVAVTRLAWLRAGRRRWPVHLHRSSHPLSDAPGILYLTGDGGWRGLDRLLFHMLAESGWPVAGLSTPVYLRQLPGGAGVTTPEALALDIMELRAFAGEQPGWPAGRPLVLAGYSRGAGLAVAAAGHPLLGACLGGVLAIGLTPEEEHVHLYRPRRGGSPVGKPRRDLSMLEMRDYWPRLGQLPLAVIQSAADGYWPAAGVRSLLGPDSPCRSLLAVPSGGHNFAGGRPALGQAVRQALAWLQQTAGCSAPAAARP